MEKKIDWLHYIDHKIPNENDETHVCKFMGKIQINEYKIIDQQHL